MRDIKLFEAKKVRTHWDEETEQWFFSVIDVVEILTDSSNPRDYWFKMKNRVKTEDGLELSTVCRQLKMKAPNSGASLQATRWHVGDLCPTMAQVIYAHPTTQHLRQLG